mmetsp:Transcript_38791/g.97052  ORF Transcript_38791/g.97052 Transcript_38791/m.97052 type:complete len:243 (-) Transcript_38791:136-864(-)
MSLALLPPVKTSTLSVYSDTSKALSNRRNRLRSSYVSLSGTYLAFLMKMLGSLRNFCSNSVSPSSPSTSSSASSCRPPSLSPLSEGSTDTSILSDDDGCLLTMADADAEAPPVPPVSSVLYCSADARSYCCSRSPATSLRVCARTALPCSPPTTPSSTLNMFSLLSELRTASVRSSKFSYFTGWLSASSSCFSSASFSPSVISVSSAPSSPSRRRLSRADGETDILTRTHRQMDRRLRLGRC